MSKAMTIPIHQRDIVVLDEHRLRDETDLRYQSTYHFIKDAFCHAERCKHGGNCGVCPARELRRYAARDSDRIGELMKALQEKDSTIAYLRGRVMGLEKNVEVYDNTINKLQREIAQLKDLKKLPF